MTGLAGRRGGRRSSIAPKPANEWRWAFRLAQSSHSEVAQQALDWFESRNVKRIADPVTERMAMADRNDPDSGCARRGQAGRRILDCYGRASS